MKKHLLFFVFLFHKEGLAWKLTNISPHEGQFDGKKIACIAMDEETMQLENVLRLMEDHMVEFDHVIPVINDPKQRETRYFLTMLASVIDEPGLTFYCHSKGVWQGKSNRDAYRGAKKWVKLLYEENLGNPAMVDTAMEQYTFGGVLRARKPHRLVPVPWHYSGTFFWINNQKLRNHNWARHAHWGRYGTEAYPGGIVDVNESVCFKYDHFDPSGSIYNEKFWDQLQAGHTAKDGYNQKLQQESVADDIIRHALQFKADALSMQEFTNYVQSKIGTE